MSYLPRICYLTSIIISSNPENIPVPQALFPILHISLRFREVEQLIQSYEQLTTEPEFELIHA